ncbi:MAG: LacI family DNA-binding transcriptional regulator [Rikenellaceae bacterium]
MKRVTIKDIAEHLTISVSTVSRALSDDKNIRKETKEEVLKAARELGYMPNPVAVNLRCGRTNTVGVLVPEMVTPYASNVIRGIQRVLYAQGIKVIIADSHECFETERENLQTMERFMVDGIILSICDYKKNQHEYERLQREGMPLVFFDRIPNGIEASQVIVDDYIKSFFLVEHLIRSGKKNIVHFKGPDTIYNSQLRLRGYKEALSKFHLNDSDNLVIEAGRIFNEGAAAVDKLIASGVAFDSIFAFTDTVGIGALNRLRELGYSIPSEVSVSSFSGTELSTITYPQLTSVSPPLEQMGIESARLLLEKIKNPESPTRSIVLDADTIYRASTIIND